jgi:hypothetical protein
LRLATPKVHCRIINAGQPASLQDRQEYFSDALWKTPKEVIWISLCDVRV